MDNFSSKYLENAVKELSRLPGIGKRSALRLALWLHKRPEEEVVTFVNAILTMRTEIKFCETCFTLSDVEHCEICTSSQREFSTICVVADVRDVMAIENTGFYKGLYHVLGGIISPVEGILPSNLTIDKLLKRVETNADIKEIILALPATMEGDTTNFYIHKQLKKYDLLVSTIARGISVGDDLEYTDEVTLGRSILNRIPVKD